MHSITICCILSAVKTEIKADVEMALSSVLYKVWTYQLSQNANITTHKAWQLILAF